MSETEGVPPMDDAIGEFRRLIERSSEQLLAISEEESRRPTRDGKWSPKEIIGHLIDSACNNHRRFVLAQLQEDLVFPGYEQEQWVQVQRYVDEAWPQLVLLWKSYNLHLSHVMACAPEDVRTRPRMQHSLDRIATQEFASDQPATLDDLMRDYIVHLRNHLAQIFR